MNRGIAAAFVPQTAPEGTGLAVHTHRRHGWRRVATAAVALAGLVACLLPAVGLAAAAAEAPVPVLDWQRCAEPTPQGFDCATAQVPLDYGDPQGATINLAVIRHLATDPAQRLGALFFNPGGPGDAGTEELPAWFALFPVELRTRFDLISWDPRGVCASTAVQCFDTPEEGLAFLAGLPTGFPVGQAEQRAWLRGYARFGQLCGERNGDLLAHVSTAESAKDLELLRPAMGAPHMNYLGVSYGTLLGATYANLFPDQVRAMVLDGNVDPVAYTNGGEDRTFLGTSLRLRSDIAAGRTLSAFLGLCGQASTDRCAFSAGSPTATQAKWTTLLQRLREHQVTLDSVTFTSAVLASAMNVWLTTTEPQPRDFKGWTHAAGVLQQLWELSDPDGPPAAAHAAASGSLTTGRGSAARRAPAGVVQPYPGPEQRFAVACAESPNPRNPLAFLVLDTLTYARAGDIGRWWIWTYDEPCASWPAVAADRYAGPWDRPTANPILVIGNTFDPETPYEGAVAMADELARARLLTVDGYGHSALLNPSGCTSQYVRDYLIDGRLPPEGTVWPQDYQPFTMSPSPATR